WIIRCHLDLQILSASNQSISLCNMKSIAVRSNVDVQPDELVKVDRIHDQRVAFRSAERIALARISLGEFFFCSRRPVEEDLAIEARKKIIEEDEDSVGPHRWQNVNHVSFTRHHSERSDDLTRLSRIFAEVLGLRFCGRRRLQRDLFRASGI